jgi:hypothetical protein
LDTVRLDAGLGGFGFGASTLACGGAGGVIGSRMMEGADARFHEGGQPLNVQAGEGLLFAALGMLDLCPPGLASLVNRQSYDESNSPLCSFLPQGGRRRLPVLCLGTHGLPCLYQGALGLSAGLVVLGH